MQEVQELFDLFIAYGASNYIGEPVSQWEHAFQSAQLAEQARTDEELILAALFHDIGHLYAIRYPSESMGGYGAVRHEILGANYLRRLGFSERIAQLVENHVQAKRYLTYKYPEYLASLSEASLRTLQFQGGPMQEEEALAFENNPLFADSLQMRRWDEQAKVMHLPAPSADLWQEIALRHLQAQESTK